MIARRENFGWRRMAAVLAVVLAAIVALSPCAAHAMKIQRVTSPGGIEAWLVQENALPLVVMSFAFRGGASQDPVGKIGVAHMTASLLDEGAGALDSAAFRDQLERYAIEMRFRAGQDYLRGRLRTLTAHQDKAFELLRLAVNAPRFDPKPVERIRSQIMVSLRRAATNPGAVAWRRWWAAAFPHHPYGRNSKGTIATVPHITADDLKNYSRRVLAREHLTVVVVGDIDAKATAAMLDRVFGALPAKSNLQPIPATRARSVGRRIVVDLDVPQTVVTFGGPGIARSDPDFMTAFAISHILSGGTFSSRLYREVREKRGLAYSVGGSLVWYRNAALYVGSTATRTDRTKKTIELIEREVHRLAQAGPTATELAEAKSYLRNSFALHLDTSFKIAGQLVQIQLDHLGIDYIHRREQLIDAITLADARRVAKRLLDAGLLVTVVGRPSGVSAKGGRG
jgi:zinc protease